jgi:nicotinamidase/pyrazinamidase
LYINYVSKEDHVIDRRRDALLIVDLQRDFLTGGALAVPDSEGLGAAIADFSLEFDVVVATQDFHPPGHVSFATSHAGRMPFDTIMLYAGEQRLWPDHCVAGSLGAALDDTLPDARLSLILRKGTRSDVDSYSAFRENTGPDGTRPSTGLGGFLTARGIKRLFVVGVARDYCVRASAVDAVAAGFETFIVEDLVRAVDPSSAQTVDRAFAAAGVRRTESPAWRAQPAERAP